jgi:hypothetical protein
MNIMVSGADGSKISKMGENKRVFYELYSQGCVVRKIIMLSAFKRVVRVLKECIKSMSEIPRPDLSR